jgi:hypothetical protein
MNNWFWPSLPPHPEPKNVSQVESYCDIVPCHETAFQTKITAGTAKEPNASLLETCL